MSKYDKEFYKSLQEAVDRFMVMIGKAKNVHIIKNKYSEYYVVCWEKL